MKENITKEKILKSLRKENIPSFAFLSPFCIVVIGSFFYAFYDFIFNGMRIEITSYLLISIPFLILGIIVIAHWIQLGIVTFDPKQSHVVKVFGGIEQVVEIVNEIMSNVKYEDKNIIISDRYIMDKKSFDNIVSISDVKKVYKSKIRCRHGYLINSHYLSIECKITCKKIDWLIQIRYDDADGIDVDEVIEKIKETIEANKEHTKNSEKSVTTFIDEETNLKRRKFMVILTDVGANEINVIKAVREVTGLGLKEAKEIVCETKTIKEGVFKEEAEAIEAKLAEVGATVKLF